MSLLLKIILPIRYVLFLIVNLFDYRTVKREREARVYTNCAVRICIGYDGRIGA